MSVVFTAVARGGIIIASHAPTGVNLERNVQNLLEQPLTNNEQRRMNYYIFTVHKGRLLNFVCATTADSDRSFPIKYLETISAKWNLTIGEKGSWAGPHSLSREAIPIFNAAMSEVSSMSKTETIKRELDQTQRIVTDSLHMAIARGEELESLNNKSETLMATSEDFKTQATNLKRRMCLQKAKSWGAIGAIVLLLFYIILASSCGGLALPRCFHRP